MQPAKTPRIYSEFCGAVGDVWHLWQVKGTGRVPRGPSLGSRVEGAIVWSGQTCPDVTSWKTSAFSPPWICDHPDSEMTQQPTENPVGGPQPPFALPNQ